MGIESSRYGIAERTGSPLEVIGILGGGAVPSERHPPLVSRAVSSLRMRPSSRTCGNSTPATVALLSTAIRIEAIALDSKDCASALVKETRGEGGAGASDLSANGGRPWTAPRSGLPSCCLRCTHGGPSCDCLTLAVRNDHGC
jgi:hypothetical protein